MRSILVHADREAAMDTRMAAALALTRGLRGHLTVLVDTPVGRFVTSDPMANTMLATEALTQALAADDERAATIEAELRREGIDFTVARQEGEPIDTLNAATTLADLVVLSRDDGVAEAFVRVSRIPVFVVAEKRPIALPPAVACVAWDGSRHAGSALRASIPLLSHCRSVRVVTIGGEDAAASPQDAIRYLSLYGIEASAAIRAPDGALGAQLASEARDADLLVMGAFGHGRVRELLFGGVTRHLIGDPAGPALLLAH